MDYYYIFKASCPFTVCEVLQVLNHLVHVLEVPAHLLAFISLKGYKNVMHVLRMHCGQSNQPYLNIPLLCHV